MSYLLELVYKSVELEYKKMRLMIKSSGTDGELANRFTWSPVQT